MSNLLRWLVSAVFTVWLAGTISFVALRAIPGDAILDQFVESGAGAEVIAEQRSRQGLDAPVVVQYARFLWSALQGDFGTSLLSGLPVAQVIAQQVWPTVTLALSALAVALAIGLLAGSIAGLDFGWHVSGSARLVIDIALSTPIFWTGTLLILVFSVWLGILPSSGSGRLSQLVLPVLALGFHTAGAIGQVTETSVREAAASDFVRTARAKGLREYSVVVRHVLRVGLLPVVSIAALQAGFLFGGTVITESLFVRPGLGRLMLDATLRQDYPVVQGLVVLAAVVYVIFNTIAQLLYNILDPRIASAS